MAQPSHRVAADGAIALRNVRPVDVFSEPHKNAQSTLVCAVGQHDLISFVEYSANRFLADHVSNILRFARFPIAPRLWSTFGLFTSLVFSSLARSASL